MQTLKALITTALIVFNTHTLAANCPDTETQAANSLQAQYQIKINHDGQKEQIKQLILWRHGSQVAIEYPQTHIVELWEQTKTGHLRLARYFTKQKRGIEYQPTEINKGKGETDWSLKRQLISDKLISAMTLKKTQTKNCRKQQLYTLKQNHSKQKLTWLPEVHLVERYSVKTSKNSELWRLENLNSNAQDINAFFEQLQTYQTTDYTDIGDNESDPFLQKMIHLGFIEHSHSGFYEAPQSKPSKGASAERSHTSHEH